MEALIIGCLIFLWLVVFGADLIALIILVIVYFSFIDGNFDNTSVPWVKIKEEPATEVITVPPTEEQMEDVLIYRRKESCPHVPEEYGIVWIEYNGELTCTQGEKK